MNLFNIFKKKKKVSEQLTIQEKWALDCESYNNSNFTVETGESQCYKCKNRIKGNSLKCSKFDNIDKDILFGKKQCSFRETEQDIIKTFDDIKEFKYNEPYNGKMISKVYNVELPKEYLDFMLKHNGGEGDIGATWFVLYPLEELEKINEEIKIIEILPDSIIIGSNGAGELYGIDSNGEYFNVPEIIEKEYITKLGKDFNKLPNRINQIWK